MSQNYKEVSLFQDSEIEVIQKGNSILSLKSYQKRISKVSLKMLKGFSIVPIPFLGCDFDEVYPLLAGILPQEKIVFNDLPFSIAVVCEIICSAICHQMNWDFLRETVKNKTTINIDWLSPNHLTQITEEEVFGMFSNYSNSERIRKEERTKILHKVGRWLKNFDSVQSIFFNKDNNLLNYNDIYNNLLSCEVFSNDPEEKKLKLLLQKLATLRELSELAEYCKPAIDYHLIRCYLRRGLLVANTKYAKDFFCNPNIERKESTMAGIRHLCSELLLNICTYTKLNANVVNQIEWNIGRSVCIHNNPDCLLKSENARWLRIKFNTCPFINCCTARANNKLLHINEPIYRGTSY